MIKQLPKHLSQDKKDELKIIADIIKNASNPLMIILFGSYARGDFVEYDQSTTKEGITESYESDFDILVIVRKKKTEKNLDLWYRVEESISSHFALKTKVKIIIDQADFVNEKLKQGRYFYADIYNEGVMLFDNKEFVLNKPTEIKNLDIKEKLKQAKEYFKGWLDKAEGFLRHYNHALKDYDYFSKRTQKTDCLNKSAFNLHQTAKTLFNTLLLTFTLYSPKTHNLEDLDKMAVKIDERFKDIFPRKTDREKDLFELLKKAYVDARYSLNYKITKTQLKALEKNIKQLEDLVKLVCEERIKGLKKMKK